MAKVDRSLETIDQRLFEEAKTFLVGGVNSPVRSFKAVGGTPVFIKSGRGSRVYSEDDKAYIDYCLSWGALILGHGRTEITDALKKTIDSGTAFGAATKLETEFAKTIREAIPSMEKVRLTNSGTEAVMGAVRLARAFTNKDTIIKFEGAYHGSADYLLNCKGVPEDFKKHTVTVPYNDIEAAEDAVERDGRGIAAIIVEPVLGNAGVVLPREGFLRDLRRITKERGILLIFDEVITGFRLACGGAQGLFNVKPDLTCLGKIIGGGLPVGAFGGRREIMDLLAPEGDVYQAGTFSGNPLTVAGGLATLEILKNERPHEDLAAMTKSLCDGILEKAGYYGIEFKINYIGSMFGFSFKRKDLVGRFYHGLLEEGVYFSPSAAEADFLSTAHSASDIDSTLRAVDKVFKSFRR